MKVAVIGQGYVGHPLALAAAKAGHEVIGFDIDLDVISKLKQSVNLPSNLELTVDIEQIKNLDIYIIAVPTPLDLNNKVDLTSLTQAAVLISNSCQDNSLVINESTSYPGTLREVVMPLVTQGKQSNTLFAAAPERIDPLNKDWQLSNTARVIGGLTDRASDLACEFYESFCKDVVRVSSPEVAESAKLLENTFRQVNIALINQFAQIMNKFNLPVHEVIDAAATKPFGFMKFLPGLGVGGHCIPIDPIYLAEQAEAVGAPTSIIRLSDQINTQMVGYVVSLCKKLLNGDLKNKSICVVGLSYKRNISDLRNSPSLLLWDLLVEAGANLSYIDDFHPSFRGKESADLKANNFDLSIVAIHHDGLDIESLKLGSKVILDCTGSIQGVNSI
jgi:UDP-N-acetyl-D-glucosamine dehydrogenase